MMITGTGVDIIEIKRLESVVKRWGDLFLKRVFTDTELNYSKKKAKPFEHLAARFAAKEAVYKAYGTNPKLNFKDIEISNDRFGRPHCSVRKKAVPVLLSISHTDKYAVACAVIQKKSRGK